VRKTIIIIIKKIALVIVKDKIETFKNYMSNIETF
jgi:hypothetical protein